MVNVSTNAGSGTGATWAARSSGLPNRVITRIAVDPTVATTAFAVVSGFQSGHVFKTTNAGVSWSNISGDLPDIPVNDVVIDPDVQGTLYIATDIGVFSTSNVGQNWSAPGSGLPRVVVVGLALHHPTRTLRAATHGRSAWDLPLGPPAASNWQLTLNPASATVSRRRTATTSCTVSSINGWSGTVTMSAANLPAGVKAVFGRTSLNVPASGSAGVSLQLQTSTATAAGTYSISVNSASGGTTIPAVFTLKVN
jgi:photosystem II stability/assembly factor-like uncharacterized protein